MKYPDALLDWVPEDGWDEEFDTCVVCNKPIRPEDGIVITQFGDTIHDECKVDLKV